MPFGLSAQSPHACAALRRPKLESHCWTHACSGGLELLFGNQKEYEVDVPANGEQVRWSELDNMHTGLGEGAWCSGISPATLPACMARWCILAWVLGGRRCRAQLRHRQASTPLHPLEVVPGWVRPVSDGSRACTCVPRAGRDCWAPDHVDARQPVERAARAVCQGGVCVSTPVCGMCRA